MITYLLAMIGTFIWLWKHWKLNFFNKTWGCIIFTLIWPLTWAALIFNWYMNKRYG